MVSGKNFHKWICSTTTEFLVLTKARLRAQILELYQGPITPRCSPLCYSLSFLFSSEQQSSGVVVYPIVIAMASIRFINLLLFFNPLTATLGYGFIRPTRPPSMDEINGELRKRRLPENSHCAIPYSWCAFLEGDFGKSEVHSSSNICVTKQSLYKI